MKNLLFTLLCAASICQHASADTIYDKPNNSNWKTIDTTNTVNNKSYNNQSDGNNTHYVNSYTRDNGTTVDGHYSGNPSSGVHCHNNVCN